MPPDTQRPPAESNMFGGPIENVDIQQAIQIVAPSNRGEINIQNNRNFALDLLRDKCSPNATLDAEARYDPPRCSASTRTAIIHEMENWVNEENAGRVPSSVFWLYGGAGVGKSALAQTLAEKYQKNGRLAASFFFFRSDNSRNQGGHLIPTLVWQLIRSFRGLGSFVEEAIRADEDVFFKNVETRMLRLLVEPFIRLSLDVSPESISHPRLIVIDGLDECSDPEVQCSLLRVIAQAIPHIPYPLRFLITSRPEAHIIHTFNHDWDLQAKVHHYDLSNDSDAHKDIRMFLEYKFKEIHRVHPLRQYLSPGWPDKGAIDALVDRSSGHFIYASTVIKYIQSRRHRPDDRLGIILGLLHRRQNDRPYAQLDALYTFILLGVEDSEQLEQIHRALGIMHLQSRRHGYFAKNLRSCRGTIEELLAMKPGDLDLLFDPLLSLIAIDRDIRVYHKSLFDYLLDSGRSGDLHLDLSLAHETIATHIMMQIRGENWLALSQFTNLAYHCQFARLNDDLRHYLRSHEILLTTSRYHWLTRCIEAPADWMDYLSQVMHREDFDPSGKCFKTYLEFWESQNLLKKTFNAKLKLESPGWFSRVCKKMENLLLGRVAEWNDLPSDMSQRIECPTTHTIRELSPTGSVHNVILFGGTGSERSSIVNMLVGRNVATVSGSCTLESTACEVHVENFTYRIHNIPLLSGSKDIHDWDAVDNTFMHIRQLDGVSLLIFCIPEFGERHRDWELIDKHFFRQRVPIIAVWVRKKMRWTVPREWKVKDLREMGMDVKVVVPLSLTDGMFVESRRRLLGVIKSSLPRKPWSKGSKDQWFAKLYRDKSTRIVLRKTFNL